MPKVLLIKAAARGGRDLMQGPPLGLMYLAAILRKAGHECRIVDLRLSRDVEGLAEKAIRGFSPDIVGISGFYNEANGVHMASALAKTIGGPGLPVMAGGPYATAYPEEVLADLNIDLAAVGEGERSIVPVVSALLANETEALAEIPGIAYRFEGRVVKTGPALLVDDLDALPHPAWDLVDISAHAGARRFCHLPHRRYMPLFTSRSCPWHCIYCHNVFGKKFRARSPESVAEEIEILVSRHGIEEIEIVDDIFNLDTARAEAVCDKITARGLRVRLSFPNGVRTDILTPRLLEKMKAAGTYMMGVAVETGSKRLQREIRKNLDLAKVLRNIALCRKMGIMTIGFFMMGFPGETVAEMEETIAFARRSKLNFATFSTVRPFKGTRLWDMAGGESAGLTPKHSTYLDRTGNISGVPDAVFRRLVRKAYLSFHATALSRIFLSGAFRHVSLAGPLSVFLSQVAPGFGAPGFLKGFKLLQGPRV